MTEIVVEAVHPVVHPSNRSQAVEGLEWQLDELVARTSTSRSVSVRRRHTVSLGAPLHSFWAHRLGASAAIVGRAVDRGELPATANANLIVETVVGPIWLRLLRTGEPVDDDFADHIAERVTIGARHQ